MTLKSIPVLLCFSLLMTVLAGCKDEVPEKKADKEPAEEKEMEDPAKDQSNTELPTEVVKEETPKTETPQEPTPAPTAKPKVIGEGDVKLTLVSPAQYEEFIASQKGKIVVVDFWGTWCIPCIKKYPQMLGLGKKYADQDVVLVSMAFDAARLKDSTDPDAGSETPEDVGKRLLEFLNSKKSTIPNLACTVAMDEGLQGSFEKYEIDGSLPHVRVYGKDGKLQSFVPENFDDVVTIEKVEALIQAALK